MIYAYGCITCGRIGRAIRRVTRYCDQNEIPLEVRNTKEDEVYRAEQVEFLRQAELPTELYTAIVVEEGEVIRLLEWNS